MPWILDVLIGLARSDPQIRKHPARVILAGYPQAKVHRDRELSVHYYWIITGLAISCKS